MVPQVETVEQAQNIVHSSKFGPAYQHARSIPPGRWFPGVGNIPVDNTQPFWANQNRQAAVVIQVESMRSVSNLPAILEAVGNDIDAVFMGMMDIRIDMGLDNTWGEEPVFLDLVEKVTNICKDYDVPFANQAFPGLFHLAEGRVFGLVGIDIAALWGQRGLISEARSAFRKHRKMVDIDGSTSHMLPTSAAVPTEAAAMLTESAAVWLAPYVDFDGGKSWTPCAVAHP